MYPAAKGYRRDRGQRSRNVVVERSGESASPSSLVCHQEILLMGRRLHGQYLLMLATWL
jgi:hypothetical protein